MKIILNPKYEHLRSYLTHLEEHFERDGKEIFRDRNILRTLQVGDLTLCVKKYALPSLSARVAQRIAEACRLGFRHILIPEANMKGLDHHGAAIDIVPVRRVEEALRQLFG